jgi:ketosteroid isomerase-like protein
MKKILFLLFFCSAILCCKAQTNDETAIRNAMNKQIKDWNNGDIDGFMQTYWQSDSVLFVSNPPTYGWQQTLDRYKKHYPDTAAMGKLSFDLLELKQLSPEYYFVLGNFYLKRNAGDVGGIFTLLFKKINGQWLIVVDHTS